MRARVIKSLTLTADPTTHCTGHLAEPHFDKRRPFFSEFALAPTTRFFLTGVLQPTTHSIEQNMYLIHSNLRIVHSFTYISQDGLTGLMAASLNGHAEIVDTLLQHRARVDLQKEVPNYYISISDTTKICFKAVINVRARVDLQKEVPCVSA